jgi:hypothetical protein
VPSQSNRVFALALTLIALAGVFAAAPAAAADDEPIEVFSANAIPPAGRGRPSSIPLRVYVYRYATDEERVDLAKTLLEQGPQALLAKLEKLEMGRVVPTNGLGASLAAVRVKPTEDGGRNILAVTDRPIQFIEAWSSTRTMDYPFGIVELNVDAKGKGTGRLLAAARITVTADHQIEVERYEAIETRMINVRTSKKD